MSNEIFFHIYLLYFIRLFLVPLDVVLATCFYFIGPLTAMLRDLVLAKLGRNQEQSVVMEAKKKFLDFYNGKPLSADLMDPVCLSGNIFLLAYTVLF